jgi:hypothetical protein
MIRILRRKKKLKEVDKERKNKKIEGRKRRRRNEG